MISEVSSADSLISQVRKQRHQVTGPGQVSSGVGAIRVDSVQPSPLSLARPSSSFGELLTPPFTKQLGEELPVRVLPLPVDM